MQMKAGQGPPGDQDATRCPKCPAKISKRKNSGSKNTQDKSQIVHSGPTNDRTLRSKLDHNYVEPDSDDANMEEDSEENSDEDSDEIRQGYLHTSTDPRRIGQEEAKPSRSTPGNCVKPFHSNRTQKIKRYG